MIFCFIEHNPPKTLIYNTPYTATGSLATGSTGAAVETAIGAGIGSSSLGYKDYRNMNWNSKGKWTCPLSYLQDGNHIGKGLLWPDLSCRVPVKHNFHPDTQNTLTKENVANSFVNVVAGRLTRVDLKVHIALSFAVVNKTLKLSAHHETIHELHGLRTRTTELSGHNNLATLGTGLHDETHNTVACPTYART